MPATRSYQYHSYDAEGTSLGIEAAECVSDSAARHRAGRIAKANNGPVDLAFDTDDDWSDRYITTANPSEYHSAGYSFERLN